MKSTPTNLTPPKVGKPLKRSWVESVTGNMNREQIQPGSWTEGPVNFASAPSPYINPVMLRVKNMTGLSLPMFSVLRITSPEITDKASFPHTLRGQQNEFLGYVPKDSCDEKIVITSYYADPETVLPCMITGPTPVKILYPDRASLDYPYAVPLDGDHTRLLASPFGKIRILWHSQPETPQEGCDVRTLWSWVCMGENGEWAWYKLQEDLSACGNAMALLTDECGNQVGECPIYRDVYGPKGYDICGCENAQTGWKAGDVVPAMWYEYLCRWVTIPNFNANFVESEVTVLTGINIEDIKWEPTGECRNVLIDVELDTTKIGFTTELVPVEVSGSGELDTTEVTVTGPVEVSGEVEVSGDVEFEVDTVADVGGTCSISGTAPVEVSGKLEIEFSGSEEVEVLDDIEVSQPVLGVTSGSIQTVESAEFTNGFLRTDGAKTEIDLEIETELSESGITTENSISFLKPTNSEYVTDVSSNFSGSVDLSGYITEKTVVTGISLSDDGCTIMWTTETIRVLRDGADLSSVPISLSGGLTVAKSALESETKTIKEFSATGLSNALKISGTVQIPIEVTGNINLTKSGANFLTGASLTGGMGVTKTTKTISIPKAGKAEQEVTLTGEADLGKASSTFSVSGLTANVQALVSDNIKLGGNVTLSNESVSMSGEVGANVTISTGNVEIPVGIEVEDGGVRRSFECIPIYELEGGEVTGVSKKTIRLLTCGECE